MSAIWWIRRDLRVQDNPALQAALEAGGAVFPLFILDPTLLQKPAEKRQGFLMEGLRCLDKELQALGSRLIVREGRPQEVLKGFFQESGAGLICAEEDYSPYARRRDTEVEGCLSLKLVHGVTFHPPSAIHKADGSPYTVFTPFSRAWKAFPPGEDKPIKDIHKLPSVAFFDSAALPQMSPPVGFPAGEKEARNRLDAFLYGPVYHYYSDHDRVDLHGTAELSSYLRFGMLSIRQAVLGIQKAVRLAPDAESRRSCEAWLGELIWREFYNHTLLHFPKVLKGAYKASGEVFCWREDPADLQAWRDGLTGYPVVDAGMRQLVSSGWMQNRARMITASFLVKDLLIHWQHGEEFFMQHLVDGDPAANNGGWQWSAGTGTDSAPFFRIFNPVLQGQKFDPQGKYVRTWVPELTNVPLANLHAPWTMPDTVQRSCGCRIGQDYPGPMVDHAQARERALQAYRKSRMMVLPKLVGNDFHEEL